MDAAPEDDLCGMPGKNDALPGVGLAKAGTPYFSLPLTFSEVWRATTGNPQ
ncbi:MAG: hypothetical protein WBA92_04525 [Pseudorhodobacter sp.]